MTIIMNEGDLQDPFRSFISKSRYARWITEYGRRETWEETVDRYINYMASKVDISDEVKAEAKSAILNHEVMPSMRAMMTAGEAAERSPIAAYNCSFLAVDNPRAFDETLMILMSGTGLGFSAEKRYVRYLPEVPAEIDPVDEVIVVHDSKEGWAQSYRELIAYLYKGELPRWDLRQLRPKGARLKTFGGRSSGPEPLNELFEFTVKKFAEARGRKFNPTEAHDIMCMIGNIVVVGGVRRSALISLGSLDDDGHRDAKKGEWWKTNPQRALANNSAVYNSKPTRKQFDEEWNALVESGSGERGIFNLAGGKEHSPERRDASRIAGTNPSLVAGTRVYTDSGISPIEELEGQAFKVRNLNGELSNATCWKSGEDKTIFKVAFAGGHEYHATEEHKWPVLKDGQWVRTKTTDLTPGDIMKNTLHDSLYNGSKGSYDEGFLIGWNLGDGWQTQRERGLQIGFIVSDDDRKFGAVDDKINRALDSLGSKSTLRDKDEINVNSQALRELFVKYGVKHKSEGLPDAVWDASVSDDFRKGLVDGLLSSDGSVNVKDGRITFIQKSDALTSDLSDLLGFFGVKTHRGIRKTTGRKAFGDHPAYRDSDVEFTSNALRIGGIDNISHFHEVFQLTRSDKEAKVSELASKARKKGSPSNETIKVVSVQEFGTADVWDISVDDVTHAFRLPHVVSGNCGEILLRNMGFCNLSETVVRPEDTLDDLKRKIALASKIGTWQSTLTNFPYLRPEWQQNAEDERLLGVSLTGQMGHSVLNGSEGKVELRRWLKELKHVAVMANKKEARRLGINQSKAVTTVKPSGTVSTLVNSSSGMHAWHDRFYIRRVRSSKMDPIGQFLMDAGVPAEDDVMNSDNTVFSFPFAAPADALVRSDMTAIDQLEIWLEYKTNYTEHNPSVTISVKSDEWKDVGDWVFDNFDQITGLSFLPHSDHTYQQAPFETVDEEVYLEALSKMPKAVDWTMLPLYETEDGTTGMQELACVAGECSVVDLVKD